ncbi:hypothetical protein ASPWEDRAFT_73746, partial [Aspergillus wentii DTO 134E9]
CVQCDQSAPQCPTCDEGYICTMISQSCNQCATTKCVQTSSSSSSSPKDNSPAGGSNAGAIAGGVIGGLAFIGIITFLVWWFFVRKKRNEQESAMGQEKQSSFAERASARKSTNSIASTVLTRASNVIQIAYIPGVTNRSPPETPGSLVPPVPPLPGAAPDQHFFMPGDLRDSSWTDMTNERRSVAPSLRSSVATTIYRNNAIVSPMPAQQVMRTRAAVVSIHGQNPEDTATAMVTPSDAPAVPAITNAQLAKAGVPEKHNGSSIVARGVMAKPVMVKSGSIKKINKTAPTPTVQPIEEQSESSNSSAAASRAPSKHEVEQGTSGFDESSDEEDEAGPSKQTKTPAIVEDSTAVTQSPFKDQPTPPETDNNRLSYLSETNDGTRSNRSSKLPPRGESPFSDANEV